MPKGAFNPEDYAAASEEYEVKNADGPDGQDLDLPSPPVSFPLHCLPESIQTMGRAIAQTVPVPESLAGCCVLGILSSSIGAGLQVQSALDCVTRGNVYVLSSAPSGCGKSETFRHAAAPFIELEHGMIERWQRSDLSSLQADQEVLEIEIKQLKSKIKSASKKNSTADSDSLKQDLDDKLTERMDVEKSLHAPILSVEDVTIEELAFQLSVRDEMLASLSSDAGAIINNLLGRYSKPTARKRLYTSRLTAAIRAKLIARLDRRSISKRLVLPFSGSFNPTSSTLCFRRRRLPKADWSRAFLRVIRTLSRNRLVKTPLCIAIATREAYHGVIKSLIATYRLGSQVYTVIPTEEAKIAMRNHYNAVVTRRCGELRDVTSYAARWNEQAWRIAVCLHAGSHGPKAHEELLSADIAENAIELADWFANEQLEILKTRRTDRRLRRAQSLLSHILDYGGKQTLRELGRRHGFQHDECLALAKEFPGLLRYQRIEPTSKGGHPSEVLVAVRNLLEGMQTN
jgi:hypothetical protein